MALDGASPMEPRRETNNCTICDMSFFVCWGDGFDTLTPRNAGRRAQRTP
jgi:hypothetical protein